MKFDKRFNRLAPDAGPEHFVTHRVSAPVTSHWRPSTCEEIECDDYVNGFIFTADMSTDLGQRQYDYLIHDRTRSHTRVKVSESLMRFIYRPGNRGFGEKHASHVVPIGRPPMYLIAQGDFRGNPRGIPVKVHRTVEDFVDESWNHFDRLRTIQQRG